MTLAEVPGTGSIEQARVKMNRGGGTIVQRGPCHRSGGQTGRSTDSEIA